MTSEPARLAEISPSFTEISVRRDEIFSYEHAIPVRRDGNLVDACVLIN